MLPCTLLEKRREIIQEVIIFQGTENVLIAFGESKSLRLPKSLLGLFLYNPHYRHPVVLDFEHSHS